MRLGSSRSLYYRSQTVYFFDEPRTPARFLPNPCGKSRFPLCFLAGKPAINLTFFVPYVPGTPVTLREH